MKRTERQHLKENEVQNFVRVARQMFETRRGESTAIIGVVVAVVLAAAGYYGWHEHVQSRAAAPLAEAEKGQDARLGPPPAPGTPPNRGGFPAWRGAGQGALAKAQGAPGA